MLVDLGTTGSERASIAQALLCTSFALKHK